MPNSKRYGQRRPSITQNLLKVHGRKSRTSFSSNGHCAQLYPVSVRSIRSWTAANATGERHLPYPSNRSFAFCRNLQILNSTAVRIPRFGKGYGNLGLKALSSIVPLLKTRTEQDAWKELVAKGVAKREEVPASALGDHGPCRYSTAVRLAGYKHHSDFRDGELLEELPYYGEVLRHYTSDVRSESAPPWEQEYGRLANPTVHIGLGQLRKLINALIKKYGPPEEIVVELARDLKRTQQERKDIEKRQAENQAKNEQRKEKIVAAGISMRGDALLRMRLWEELSHDASDRRCVYSGRQISMAMLFSEEVEIEHILPFTRSLDDSPANLTVALRSANRLKRNNTPHEAFGGSPAGFDWPAIMVRVSALPKVKQWRFRHDALDLVADRTRREAASLEGSLPKDALDDIEKTGGFLARQLVDTAYLARLTRQYLWKVCDPNKTWVIPGQMTALLRRKWGLNSLLSDHNQKSRTDHRHHAVDAFAVGMTDRSLLQRIATAAAS
ncbi:MAG: type II CRISPR RNA-guided endonuclease Cas9 [Rhizobiales bacterium]|nr:type II CRISPR RNA-guided endonuclease Cas9 [Hyphomicrobiales bacterium]